MNTIRVKDLWMYRAAFERVFYTKVTGDTATLLLPFGEVLFTAYIDYTKSREQAWKRLGLNKPVPKWRMALFGVFIRISRARREAQFNDEMAELAETEITMPYPPLPASALDAIGISTVDRVAMKELGIIHA